MGLGKALLNAVAGTPPRPPSERGGTRVPEFGSRSRQRLSRAATPALSQMSVLRGAATVQPVTRLCKPAVGPHLLVRLSSAPLLRAVCEGGHAGSGS